MSESHVRVDNVHKKYALGSTEMIALGGLSLLIKRGEFVALSGSSGSGKTTLLNLIGGLDTPTLGDIYIGDRKLSIMNDQQLTAFRARELGFIFQTFNLLPVLSALENVEYPLLKFPMTRGERRTKATAALVQVGLERVINNRPNQLSGGQRQRVSIARAIVHGPELIIADEPTANLDKQTALGILDLLSHLNQKLGVTVVIATHDPNVIARTTRSIHISDGKLASL